MSKLSHSIVSLFLICMVHAQSPISNWPVANGKVHTMKRSGNTLYMGGDFTYIGPNIPGAASLHPVTGLADPNFPKLNSIGVYSCVPDGSGGWYIGGAFTRIGSVTRNRVARINADGTLHPWNPNLSNGSVDVITVDGNNIYIGGQFTSVGGQIRNNLACVNAGTGNVTNWNPDVDYRVYSIATANGIVYIAGQFLSVGGQARNSIAAVDAATGIATSWNPNPNITSIVSKIILNGNTVYVAGSFSSIGSQPRNGLAAIDLTTGNATSWNPAPNLPAWTIAINNNKLYVAGYFTSIFGQTRNRVAAFDLVTGNLTVWSPNVEGSGSAEVYAIAFKSGTVYLGGAFTQVGGQDRRYLAEVDEVTGNPTSWNPNAEALVWTLAYNGASVLAGGSFRSIGGGVRNGAAAIDLTTTALTSWNPNVTVVPSTQSVYDITTNGSIVYLVGSFLSVGGQIRNRIAAVDAVTGAITPWNPNANGEVASIVVNGSTVYVGGSFTLIGGQARNRLAALDAVSGLATSYNPNANNSVYVLAINNNRLYAGGQFTSVGGQTRNSLASFDVSTGAITSFNPTFDFFISAFTFANNTIYAGGAFNTVNGQSRNNVAAFDEATGELLPFSPQTAGIVNSLLVSENSLIAGGRMTSDNGITRYHVYSVNLGTGTLTPWNPNPSVVVDGTVQAMEINGSNLYTGGDASVSGQRPYLSAYTINSGTLPLNLLNFSAKRLGDTKTSLTWQTASEQNTCRFVIERSTDGRNFSPVGFTPAAGNSTVTKTYSFIDDRSTLSANRIFYRLRTEDKDGSFTLSKVVQLLRTVSNETITLWPNPAKEILQVSCADPCSLFIYDAVGRMIWQQRILSAGIETVDVSKWPKGAYTITAYKAGGIKETHRFQKH